MDAFSYLSVLVSIILGLAITQALQGVRAIVLARCELTLYTPSLIWTGLVILICIQFWWASFGLRSLQDWSFAAFAVVILQTLCLYLLAALVLPDIAGDGAVDLKAHYYRQRVWFFGVQLVMVAASLGKDVLISGALPNMANVAFHAVFALAAIAALSTRAAWLHQGLAPAISIGIVAYIAVLFARL